MKLLKFVIILLTVSLTSCGEDEKVLTNDYVMEDHVIFDIDYQNQWKSTISSNTIEKEIIGIGHQSIIIESDKLNGEVEFTCQMVDKTGDRMELRAFRVINYQEAGLDTIPLESYGSCPSDDTYCLTMMLN